MAPYLPGTNGEREAALPVSDGRIITVLVTGFGPFQTKYPVNPSYEIARSLPRLSLPTMSSSHRTIQLIAFDSPIRVCYKESRELIPALLESLIGSIDLVLHIGMASGRHYYTVERYGHTGGYIKNKDLDGELPPLDDAEKRFGICPERIETSLDFRDVVLRWQTAISQTPQDSPAYGAVCRPSEDAGHYLCDYTYFNSLAWFGKRNQKYEDGGPSDRPVLFLHVPAESDEVTLERGRVVAMALIRAMVDSYVECQVNL
ncbi:hypothetical protein M433DRAFT_4399 [Acidomyces richmondensis BFW]|nr:MAG: hypothetical protein FE78DRAFT_147838 [Acidomyces sp. 'richmondensis']KYG45648.1 hypothetical protein M433DRAFT_4399 [Acidomyces richmondensis BFW]